MPVMPSSGAMPTGMGGATPYPDGDEIMQGREMAQEQTQGQNPIVDALKTLQMYVVAKREQGDEGPLAGFMQFLDTLGGGQQMPAQPQQMAQAPQMPQAEAAQPPAPQTGPRPENFGTVLS